MKESPKFDIPAHLASALESHTAIVFIGSGLSVPAGGPKWKELMQKLAALAEGRIDSIEAPRLTAAHKAIRAGRLIEAATILRKILQRSVLQAEVATQLRQRKMQVQLSHEKLVQLPFRAFVTTNYDLLLEEAMPRVGISASQIHICSHSGFHACPYQAGRQFLLHLHGDLHNESDIVLSWQDYSEMLVSSVLSQISGLFQSGVTLWLGYGHNDPDVILARSTYPFASEGYQIVLSTDVETSVLCEARGIIPIFINNYGDVPDFLDALASAARMTLNRAFSCAPLPTHLDQEAMVITASYLAFPLEALRQLRDQFADPKIKHKRKKFKMTPDARKRLFANWAKRFDGLGQRIAIISAPGAGKTVLLSKFAKWLWEGAASPTLSREGLCPLVVYLRQGDFTDAVTNKSVWEQIEPRVGLLRSPNGTQPMPDPARPWLEKHAIYVLIDGIDEFGARRKGELQTLLNNLSSLATEQGLSVFLTCRKVFWSQQIRAEHRDPWDEFEILPFTAGEIEEIVGKGGLGRFAYDKDGAPKPGLRNHLLVSFVLALRAAERSGPLWNSRSELYEEWVRFTTSKGAAFATGVSSEEWFMVFRKIALQLLQQKATSVPPPPLSGGRTISVDECIASGILMASGDRQGVMFVHESLYEFFVSVGLRDSFRLVLDSRDEVGDFVALPLAAVDLDIPQSSVYGFLSDRLAGRYIEDLRKKFSATNMPGSEQLARNLVEYVGMVYRGGEDCSDVANWLLDLIRSEDLHGDVRYNAQRQLFFTISDN
jgi:hypothetical protein